MTDKQKAIIRYHESGVEKEEKSPLERLRFFCQLAMSGDDWVDAGHFFDSLALQVRKNVDPGPWMAGETSDGRHYLESSEFTHDVRLYVDGDFAWPGDKANYAQGLASQLNNAPVSAETTQPWAPEKCPITQRPFFMWIEHHKTGEMVPTYGGPYDSYTLAEYDGESFICERFDHDAGGWLVDCVEGLGVKLVDDQALVIDPNNTRYDEIEAFAATPVVAQAQPEALSETLESARWRNALVGLCDTDRIDTPEQAIANVKRRMRPMGLAQQQQQPVSGSDGLDEDFEFSGWLNATCSYDDLNKPEIELARDAWQARAALAQISGNTGQLDQFRDAAQMIEPSGNSGELPEDDSIALDRLADYIADTWPMDKKYSLEEICQRLHVMWPGEFIPIEDFRKNDPNLREAVRALLIHWLRFQKSDGNQQDAYNLLVKGAKMAWKFAEDELSRSESPDAQVQPLAQQDADPLQGAADWLVKDCGVSDAVELAGRLHIGYNRATRLMDAARKEQE